MANLGYFELSNTNGDYVKLSELTELTFETNKKYNCQIFGQTTNFIICFSSTKPTKGGFNIASGEKFSFTPTSDSEYIWVNITGFGKCSLNIAS